MTTTGAPTWATPITIPLSWVYRTVIAHRNHRFDRGFGVEQLSRPVISVGNISVGGTGKSPMVAWIVNELQRAGHAPVIAMRGYGSAPGKPGDEELEYRSMFDSVPILAQPDRVESIREFFEDPVHSTYDCIVLDDGFQHRRVHRSLDLVLFDATMPRSARHVLPWGLLREPLHALRRADAVVVTRAPTDAAARELIEQLIIREHGQSPIAWARHAWTGLEIHGPDGMEDASIEWLNGRRCATMLGIGNPAAMETQIESAGARIVDRITVRDHQSYDASIVGRMRDVAPEVEALIVTRKDWVKLREFLENVVDSSGWPTPVVVPRLSMEITSGHAALTSGILGAAMGQPLT